MRLSALLGHSDPLTTQRYYLAADQLSCLRPVRRIWAEYAAFLEQSSFEVHTVPASLAGTTWRLAASRKTKSMTTVRDKTHQDLPDLSDRDALPSWSPPISRVAPFDTSDLEELMRDYFRWLRDDWQLPTYPSPGSIISVPPRPLPLLPERSYSVHELALLWDVRIRRISRDIKRYHIHPIGKRGKPTFIVART